MAIAECPNGEAYALENSTGFYSTRLWRINSATAILVLVTEISVGPGTVAGVTCDPTNTLYAAMNFGGFGTAYGVNRTTGASNALQSAGQIIGTYRGIASSPSGTIYITLVDQLSNPNPPFAQYLVTLNRSTGSAASSVRSATGGLLSGPTLVFRGIRLLAVSGSTLYEINTQTAATFTIRPQPFRDDASVDGSARSNSGRATATTSGRTRILAEGAADSFREVRS